MIGWNYKRPFVFYGINKDNKIDAVRRTKKNPKGKEKRKGGGNVTQEKYIRHILLIVHARKKYLDSKDMHMVFQEDNDGGHGTNSLENPARGVKVAMNLDFIDNWPPQSPDLNPIENVYRILKQRVKRLRPTTREDLKKCLLEEWDKTTQEEINALIIGKKGMHARVQQCYERQGLQTSF